MIDHEFFTTAEYDLLQDLHRSLMQEAGGILQEGNIEKVREHQLRSIESGKLHRDAFGLNPILTDLQTALIVAQEIGLSRGALLGVVLSSVAIADACSLEEIDRDFGGDVSIILRGLLRIKELYEKSATIQTENFRSLLVTFAEDMRVILIMIANRVNVMRQIKDTPNKEAQQRVATEAAYLYAPLAHKLGLYALKSELEDLSLKYLEHDAYYHIKEKLNETKKNRDTYIKHFIQPIEEKV